MTTHVNSMEELSALVGTHVGYGEYRTVTQEQVNLFADATGDHQWIHVDPERAKAGPFGGPIAHGYLTLSLIPVLLNGVMQVDGVAMGVNYGTNKVRFQPRAGRRRDPGRRDAGVGRRDQWRRPGRA
jgi:acyl dehydratase